MKSLKFLLAAVLALSLHLQASAATPTTKADNYVITPAFMAKMQAMQKDPTLKKMKDNDDDAAEDATSKKLTDPVDDFEYKLNKDPAAKAALAKYGLTTREFSMAMVASLHAGFYLMGEAVDKKASQAAYAKFTKAQQSNIELLRKMQPTMK